MTTNLLTTLDAGTELEITEVVKDGHLDISEGDTLNVTDVRETTQFARHDAVANAEHEFESLLTEAQLKSVDDTEDVVVIPNCQGGSRVRIQKAT